MDSTGNVDCCGYLMATTWWCAFDWYRMTEGFQSMGVLHMDRVTEKPVTPVLKAAYLPYFTAGGITTEVRDDLPASTLTPQGFFLRQNYPNPFNPNTKINFSVQEKSHVKLSVIDVLGREVEVLVDEVKSPGHYDVTFSAHRGSESLPTGLYLYRLHAGHEVLTKKMLLIK